MAFERAKLAGGTLVLRNEDLDHSRARPEFVDSFIEDLRWLGIEWQEGPDVGGPYGPYNQSERMPLYQEAFEELRSKGFVYPCTCSRQEVLRALAAPHQGEEEPVYPGTCRPRFGWEGPEIIPGAGVNWRFRVPDGEKIAFSDNAMGEQGFVAGEAFGDFVIWRHDQLPSYQLAVVVDDADMKITEVVRGSDLLVSTARQIVLYRALGLQIPQFYHCPLMLDPEGQRLAKRHDALSLRGMRESGKRPEELIERFRRELV